MTKDHVKPDNVRLAVCFNGAKLKNGKTVPVKAVVVAINPPSMQGGLSNPDGNGNDYTGAYGTGKHDNGAGALAEVWTPTTLQVRQINAVSGTTMYSNWGCPLD